VGGTAGVVDAAWGAAKVEGAAREVATQGRAVGPPGVAVGLSAPVPGAVRSPGLTVRPPAPVPVAV
jgi:hypothetical protein